MSLGVYFSLVAQAAGSSQRHRVDPILIYTWRNAMSLGVYFSLVLLQVASGALCRSHSDIRRNAMSLGIFLPCGTSCW
jgi:hypothetical protein